MEHRDRQQDTPRDRTQPADRSGASQDRGRSEQGERGGVSDAGRTSGGGSLGHVQPDKVEREAPLRNNAAHRDSDEPTLPSDDASLKTNI